MEGATTSRPLPRPKGYSTFHQITIFLKDQNMKKYQHYIDVQEEVLPTTRSITTDATTSN